eukprot:gene12871-biopygen13253
MRASIPAYRKLFQQHAEYDLFRRRENAARSKQALRYRSEVVVPEIAFGPLEDPEGWLGRRRYMAYEKSLMMGPEPMCSKYTKIATPLAVSADCCSYQNGTTVDLCSLDSDFADIFSLDAGVEDSDASENFNLDNSIDYYSINSC